MLKPKFQIVKFIVNNSNEKVVINEPTKLDHKDVTAVLFSVSNRRAARGSLVKLSIDGEEILPDGFEVALLVKGNQVSMHEAKHEFLEKAQNSSIRGEYSDSGDPAITYPYDVRIYLFTTKEEENE